VLLINSITRCLASVSSPDVKMTVRGLGLRDLKGELLIMPSKDLLPSLHQMIAAAFLKNRMPLDRYQMAEHFQTGVNLTKARVGYMFLPSSAKDFAPDGVVLRTPGFSIGPLDAFALRSRGNVDPLVHRVLSLLKEIKRESYRGERKASSLPVRHVFGYHFFVK
jgi:DNA-binding transcriptional LysR family regulator